MLHRSLSTFVASATLLLLGSPALSQSILVVQSGGDRVARFDALDGTLLDQSFLDLDGLTGDQVRTPIEAIRLGQELLVSDAISDEVFRFSADGQIFLGTLAQPLDSPDGLAALNGEFLVANSGTAAGALGETLLRFDAQGSLLTAAPARSPYDVTPFAWNGIDGVLFSDLIGDDLVFAPLNDLASQSVFHDSDGVSGIHSPRQIAVRRSGHVVVAGFESPAGLYEYDAAGVQVQFIDTVALAGLDRLQGVVELANGDLLFTNSEGVHVFDAANGTIATTSTGASSRFATWFDDPTCDCATYCDGLPNSTGRPAQTLAVGSSRILDHGLSLLGLDLPPGAFTLFLTSRIQGFSAHPAGSQGNLCLSSPIGRYVGPGEIQSADPLGRVALELDLTRMPTPTGFASAQPGQTWSFQAWYRDSIGGSSATNFSSAVEVIVR